MSQTLTVSTETSRPQQQQHYQLEKIARRSIALNRTGASAVGALAVGACALGAFALGALAIGRLAIGRLAIGRLAIHNGSARQLKLGDIHISRLELEEIIIRKSS